MISNRTRERKERDRLYGQLIVDFANTKTSDEAGLKLCEGMQKAFRFSPEFVEKTKWAFPPASKAISSLIGQEEKECFALLYFQKDFGAFLGDESPLLNILGGELKALKNSLEKTADKIRETFKKGDFENLEGSGLFFEMENKIDKLRKSLGEKRYDEIAGIYQEDEQSAIMHGGIIFHQNLLIKTLKKFIDYQKPFDISILKPIAFQYQQSCSPGLKVLEDGSIVEDIPFIEDMFLTPEEGEFNFEMFQAMVGGLPHFFVGRPITYCVIEFLKTPDNRKLFRSCSRCGKYFVASKIDKRIKKCRDCSPLNAKSKEWKKEYMRGYREKKKQEKEGRDTKTRVENYVRNLDITKEEALEIIKADAML